MIEKLRERLSTYTVQGAAHHLIGLGLGNARIYWSGRQFSIYDLLKLDEDIKRLPIDQVDNVVFWGGPPGSIQEYTGTLLTYLCDAILFFMYLDKKHPKKGSILTL